MKKKYITIEKIILSLKKFWSNLGCIILQPFDLEIGAATFHPFTFFTSINKTIKVVKTCFVQSCRRPKDGRYGNKTNRLQHYYQFQVVFKPSPKNFQNFYLDSLNTLGVNLKLNDIRFLEDKWESPSLGAWGLGWEVWLNNIEITQITYFQQIGGIDCSPVTGEITYGLERIAMHLQSIDDIYDIKWNKNISYGELFLQNEKEQSTYNFNCLNKQNLLKKFLKYETTCFHLLQKKLIMPAYEKLLKSSHILNLLDSCKIIDFIEKKMYIHRVRSMACEIAKKYINNYE
ncbi:glycine--tRNA ligase subunit alpha [Candidatus Portiera aleyrodidarum]|uniref:glycine--tRNA ligase subunit alpha n=1 Tax=Candidatus Portiera aleyrodidarum TaxID=91844 RepID=UPI000C77A5CD|nr:glycine--tRNA ligase subunit alpha [Candidatus Portiera aleyrodidarum]AUI72928.1 glycine--tRNA ligase subunit alpha [Candidatus Portiera aleyrodidarum]